MNCLWLQPRKSWRCSRAIFWGPWLRWWPSYCSPSTGVPVSPRLSSLLCSSCVVSGVTKKQDSGGFWELCKSNAFECFSMSFGECRAILKSFPQVWIIESQRSGCFSIIYSFFTLKKSHIQLSHSNCSVAKIVGYKSKPDWFKWYYVIKTVIQDILMICEIFKTMTCEKLEK